MKTVFIRIFVAATAFLLVWILSMGCRRDIEIAQIPVDSTQQALMMAIDIDVIFSDSGHLQARVTGPVVNRYEGEVVWMEFPRGFKAEMFDSAQRLETTITADYGKRMESLKTMEARGNVVVRNEFKNEQLNTDVLIWNEIRHTIKTDSPVKITTPDKVLYGTGLEANETFTTYRILRPRGEMQVKEDSI
ncbi:MAG: LPS export ABC transporter periplasmic protein LptC [Bacteroidales bacterium]|nr:LPS export ABC transporter periplasmic protein LptC [Bacteroidales bacterium]